MKWEERDQEQWQVKGKDNASTKRKGKANAKGNADGQDQDQAQPPRACFFKWYWMGLSQPSQPLGKLGSKAVKYQVKALVARDQEKRTPLMKHYDGVNQAQ